MNVLETTIDGVFVIDNFNSNDLRGSFTKIYNINDFVKFGFETNYSESYYSVSNKDVIRGMHYQLPPYDHSKLIHVVKGAVLDVIVDLRTKSKTYGNYITCELNDSNRRSIYIPIGLAHGFKSLEDNTIMLYNVSTVFNAESESGIRWNSFGFDWKIDNPILSQRDKELVLFEEIISPF